MQPIETALPDASPLAGLSVDVDSVASHLAGYGWPGLEAQGEAYRVAIPRLLEEFAASGVRATFFLIATEAAAHPEVVHRIVAAGHEVASHSLTHPVPLTALPDDRLERELVDSRLLLEELAGSPVAGFRAPSFDVDDRVREGLIQAGYSYDASGFPSLLMPLLRRAVARRAATTMGASTGWSSAFGPASPNLRRSPAGSLVEIPLSTTPLLRIAHYHTLGFLLPISAFRLLGWAAALRGWGVSYLLHAVDVLGVEEDGLDQRIRRHPGMSLSVEQKLAFLRATLDRLHRVGPVVPLGTLAGRVTGARQRG